jgi:uncharacterized protein (TIGR02996 family)
MAKRKPATTAATTLDERGFLEAIQKNPGDTTARLVYADWLDEYDRPYEAILQRERAGVAEVRYKLRRKSDGLFACGRLPGYGATDAWSTRGKMWRKLSQLQGHIRTARRWSAKNYRGTPWGEVEIAVVEVRPVVVATLPASDPKPTPRKRDTDTAGDGERGTDRRS